MTCSCEDARNATCGSLPRHASRVTVGCEARGTMHRIIREDCSNVHCKVRRSTESTIQYRARLTDMVKLIEPLKRIVKYVGAKWLLTGFSQIGAHVRQISTHGSA